MLTDHNIPIISLASLLGFNLFPPKPPTDFLSRYKFSGCRHRYSSVMPGSILDRFATTFQSFNKLTYSYILENIGFWFIFTPALYHNDIITYQSHLSITTHCLEKSALHPKFVCIISNKNEYLIYQVASLLRWPAVPSPGGFFRIKSNKNFGVVVRDLTQ